MCDQGSLFGYDLRTFKKRNVCTLPGRKDVASLPRPPIPYSANPTGDARWILTPLASLQSSRFSGEGTCRVYLAIMVTAQDITDIALCNGKSHSSDGVLL